MSLLSTGTKAAGFLDAEAEQGGLAWLRRHRTGVHAAGKSPLVES